MPDYNIVLTGEELVVVGEGISSLPFRQVATVMAKIQNQINAQDAERLRVEQEIKDGPTLSN